MKRMVLALVFTFLSLPAFGQSPLPDDVCSMLKIERAAIGHPAPFTPEEIGTILNNTAFKTRDRGTKLLAKPGGMNCPQPITGTRVKCDALIIGNEWWDVFYDSDGPDNRVVCGDSSIGLPDRAIDPIDGGFNPPPPPVETVPLIEAVNSLIKQVNELTIITQAQTEAIVALRAQVAAMPAPVCPPVVFPPYEGKWKAFWGNTVTVVLNPREK